MKEVEKLWGGELPEFESIEAANELIGALVMGLWNRLTRHQERGNPFRLTRLDVPATPHSLRHSCASNIMSSNGNLRVVQQVLGHRRLSSVEIYSHPTREDLRRAVERAAEKGALPCE